MQRDILYYFVIFMVGIGGIVAFYVFNDFSRELTEPYRIIISTPRIIIGVEVFILLTVIFYGIIVEPDIFKKSKVKV